MPKTAKVKLPKNLPVVKYKAPPGEVAQTLRAFAEQREELKQSEVPGATQTQEHA